MKNIIYTLVFILTYSLSAKGQENIKTTAYEVQLAAYATPKPEDFKAVKNLGYVYELKQPTGLSKIILGTFSDAAVAKKNHESVKKLGFKDAFMLKIETDEKDAVWIVQLSSYNLNDEIFWNDWQRMTEDLCVQVWNGKVRVAAGPFRSKQEADDVLERISKQGPKDMVVKKVSSKLVHPVTPFEMGTATPKNAVASVNKRLVMDLQKVLKSGGYYNGATDGVLSESVKTSLETFKEYNRGYRDARRLALGEKENKEEKGNKEESLQGYVDMIGTDPAAAEIGLRGYSSPMAQVYLAYLYLTDLVPTPDKSSTVNSLMNGAAKKIFSAYKGTTRYDYKQKYSYDGLPQFLGHLRDMQMATYDEVAVPCFLFEKHPAEMQVAFAPYWNSDKDNYSVSPDCDNASEFEELRVLKQLATTFDYMDDRDNGKQGASERANADAAVRAVFVNPQAPSMEESGELTTWHNRLITSLEGWAEGGRLERKMANTFEVAYYEALIKLDYYFIREGLSTQAAETLAIKVVKASVNYSLKGMVN